jgi:hypothetical protein
MRCVIAFAVLSLSLAGCLAPSEPTEPDDTSAALASTHTDGAEPREQIAIVSADAREQIGEAEDEDTIGLIFGTIGGGIAGTVFGGFVFGPWGALVGGLAGSSVGGAFGAQAPGDRPPWPGGPPQRDPLGPGGDR